MEIKTKFFRKTKAFTLIELTVSMGILALIVGLTAGVLISVVKSYQKQKVITEIERNGDFVIRTIEESLRGAQNISCRKFDGVTIVSPDSAAPNSPTTCDLGAASGKILYIGNNTSNKYMGNGSDSGNTLKGSCQALTNCYAFLLDSDTQIADDGTLSNDYNKLTNASIFNGVNVSKFEVVINGGTSGVPYNITVTIDVRGPTVNSVPSTEVRTFKSFLTLRGSYQ
jgi:type II secretory pathway pseudopilin PulG